MASHLTVLSVSILWLLVCVSADRYRIPSLGEHPRTVATEFNPEDNSAMENSEILYYTQTLDHFNYRPDSYQTFQQKYILSFTYWGGANVSAPIFVYLGAESALGTSTRDVIGLSARFNGLMVSIEHRYYGDSIPFGTRDKAFTDSSTLGYFNSAQAIADYAEIILHIKKKLSAENCPVVVYGGSYGGMLAAWFRLKYPHVAVGALASSAPILYFNGTGPLDGYYAKVTDDFKKTSMSCYSTIRRSWSVIDKIANHTKGLEILSSKFKTCSPVRTSFHLKDYLDSIYCTAAQYNGAGPEFRLNNICEAIDGAPKGTGILGRVFAGVAATMGNRSCYDITVFDAPYKSGWGWQTCTEIVMPIGHGINSTMFPYSPFDLNEFSASCHKKYGIEPRPHWITTEFGGQDIKEVLAKFGSNIIFSNGLRDPYSTGGVLKNISDSIIALTTKFGSHCLEFSSPSPADPEWLARQKASEMEIIGGWIADYNARSCE